MQEQPSPAEVARVLEQVFARPEFAARETSALLQWWRELTAALRRWFFERIVELLPSGWPATIGWVLVALLVVAALWALVQLIGAIIEPRRATLSAPAAVAEPVSRDVGYWEAAARRAAAEGRFRDAALALYLAVVLRFEQHGLLRYHPGKTPGDYRRELPSDATSRSAFDRFVRQLLPTAFGPRAPDERAFAALRERATELGVHA